MSQKKILPSGGYAKSDESPFLPLSGKTAGLEKRGGWWNADLNDGGISHEETGFILGDEPADLVDELLRKDKSMGPKDAVKELKYSIDGRYQERLGRGVKDKELDLLAVFCKRRSNKKTASKSGGTWSDEIKIFPGMTVKVSGLKKKVTAAQEPANLWDELNENASGGGRKAGDWNEVPHITRTNMPGEINIWIDQLQTLSMQDLVVDGEQEFERGPLDGGFEFPPDNWFTLSRGGQKYLCDTEGYDYIRYCWMLV